MQTLTRLLALIGSVALTALIFVAIDSGDFSAAGDWLITQPWGRVTLADLYLGFLISAVLIARIESDWRVALIWILPIFVLGNVWTGLWLCVRARRIFNRLQARPADVTNTPTKTATSD